MSRALSRDSQGKLIRKKSNIAEILNKYSIIYRMVFNAMNMEQYTYNEVQEALNYLGEYIHDLGVSGIVEFHAADKTQNSDHIHFWISSEESLIYNKIAKEMVLMGYSNEEDVYIQKYKDNQRLDEKEYVNTENTSLKNRFSSKMLNIKEDKIPPKRLSSFEEKYNLYARNINNLLKAVLVDNDNIEELVGNKFLIIEECTLQKTEEVTKILLSLSAL